MSRCLPCLLIAINFISAAQCSLYGQDSPASAKKQTAEKVVDSLGVEAMEFLKENAFQDPVPFKQALKNYARDRVLKEVADKVLPDELDSVIDIVFQVLGSKGNAILNAMISCESASHSPQEIQAARSRCKESIPFLVYATNRLRAQATEIELQRGVLIRKAESLNTTLARNHQQIAAINLELSSMKTEIESLNQTAVRVEAAYRAELHAVDAERELINQSRLAKAYRQDVENVRDNFQNWLKSSVVSKDDIVSVNQHLRHLDETGTVLEKPPFPQMAPEVWPYYCRAINGQKRQLDLLLEPLKSRSQKAGAEFSKNNSALMKEQQRLLDRRTTVLTERQTLEVDGQRLNKESSEMAVSVQKWTKVSEARRDALELVNMIREECAKTAGIELEHQLVPEVGAMIRNSLKLDADEPEPRTPLLLPNRNER